MRGMRRAALVLALAWGVPWGVAWGAAQAAPPPSVVLVTLDTTRADHVGCYGAKDVATPTLDGVAREGVRFANALSPVPLTLPAHASLMTGRLPRQHGVRDNALFKLKDSERTLAEQFKAAGYRTFAAVGAAVLDRSTGIAQGFDAFDDAVRVGPREWFDWEERAAVHVVDTALALTKDVKEPLFLWVHLYDPHFPYVPPEPYRARFAGRPYDGEIAYVDAQLARLFAELKRRGQGERLIVAIAGDHGEGLGEHDERNHGVLLYQATQHVPLLLRGPGVPAGRIVDAPVGLEDLGPTLLDLAGAAALPATTGRSLRPLLGGKTLPPRDHELETFYPFEAYGWSPLRGLVRWPLKYVLAPNPELYDLVRDPAERTNLVTARAAEAADLRRALAARLGPELDRSPEGGEAIDPEQIERLRSLGYAAGGPSASAPWPAIDPKDGLPWLHDLDRARELAQSGKVREALPIFEALVRKNPGNLEATLSLLNAQAGTGQVDKAVQTGREAVRRWPALYLAHFNLANALRRQPKPDAAVRAEAEREYRAALALFPRHAESSRNLALLLLEQRRGKDARAVLEESAARGVDDSDLALLRGSVAALEGDLDAADRAFARAVELDPGSAVAWESRGKLAYQRGDRRAAVRWYREALERRPTAALARTLGAILLNDLADPAGARAAFERALQLEPTGPAADDVRALLREMGPPAAPAR